MSPMEKGMIVSIMFTGTFFANIIAGALSDMYGRRIMLLLSYLGVVVTCCASIFAVGPLSLGFARFWVGVAFGIGNPAWNALGTEISPVHTRFYISGLTMSLFSLGGIYSAILLFLSNSNPDETPLIDWRVLILLGSIPCLLLGVGAYFFLRESPYYLSAKGKDEQAQLVVNAIYAANRKGPAPLLRSSEPGFPAKSQGTWNSLKSVVYNVSPIFSAKYIYTTITLCLCIFCLNFIYYGGLYVNTQIVKNQTSSKFGLDAGPALIVASVIEIPGYVMGVYVGQTFKRKISMGLYCVLAAIAVGAMMYQPTQQLGIYGLKFFTSIGWLVFYLYTAEVFPTDCRTTGSGFVMASGRAGAIVAPLVYEKFQGTAYFHVIFAMLILSGITVYFLPFETRGVSLDSDTGSQCDSNILSGTRGTSLGRDQDDMTVIEDGELNM